VGEETLRETEYSKEGSISVVEQYRDGHLDGVKREYYPTGVIQRTSYWTDGQQNGKDTKFDDSGKIEQLPKNYLTDLAQL